MVLSVIIALNAGKTDRYKNRCC